jgi:hypothetical protein
VPFKSVLLEFLSVFKMRKNLKFLTALSREESVPSDVFKRPVSYSRRKVFGFLNHK